MRIAVTGAGGRLGRAITAALAASPAHVVIPWSRDAFDLDQPDRIGALLDGERPDRVIHAAAWTDVDGCARDPELALARNGGATGALASACAGRGVALTVVSTNEVFDGRRTDGLGYASTDDTDAANPYGRSKLEGERQAAAAFADAPERLAIVRTAWLFGAGKPDFPARIAAVAHNAKAEGKALRVVSDEIGTPTFVRDLATVVIRTAELELAGPLHVINTGIVSRADWARDVLERLQIHVEIEDITLDDYVRASRPPRWGVLEPTPIDGAPMRHWRAAMAERMTLGGFGV